MLRIIADPSTLPVALSITRKTPFNIAQTLSESEDIPNILFRKVKRLTKKCELDRGLNKLSHYCVFSIERTVEVIGADANRLRKKGREKDILRSCFVKSAYNAWASGKFICTYLLYIYKVKSFWYSQSLFFIVRVFYLLHKCINFYLKSCNLILNSIGHWEVSMSDWVVVYLYNCDENNF